MSIQSENLKTISKGITKVRTLALAHIIDGLSGLGEKAIEHAMISKKFTDRTFNLHDSYGFGIYYDRDVMMVKMNDQSATVADTRGTKGSEVGQAFLDNYQAGKGWTMIIVAGEFYAEEVNLARNGLDVLTGAYQHTQNNFELSFKKI